MFWFVFFFLLLFLLLLHSILRLAAAVAAVVAAPFLCAVDDDVRSFFRSSLLFFPRFADAISRPADRVMFYLSTFCTVQFPLFFPIYASCPPLPATVFYARTTAAAAHVHIYIYIYKYTPRIIMCCCCC